jgi:phage gp36-like protein
MFQLNEAVELSNLDDPLGIAVNNDLILIALTDASAEAEAYLRRYTLPISPVPQILRRCVADMARYYLNRYDPPDDVRKRYEDALKRLKEIAQGLLDLGLDTGGVTVPVPGGAQVRPGSQLFDLGGF